MAGQKLNTTALMSVLMLTMPTKQYQRSDIKGVKLPKLPKKRLPNPTTAIPCIHRAFVMVTRQLMKNPGFEVLR